MLMNQYHFLIGSFHFEAYLFHLFFHVLFNKVYQLISQGQILYFQALLFLLKHN